MDEYISRKAALECATRNYYPSIDHYCRAEKVATRKDLEAISPADVRPVVLGHWVWNPNGMDWGLGSWCCDQCRIKAETWWANDRKNNPLRCSGGHFCGNCGADMRPEGKEAAGC